MTYAKINDGSIVNVISLRKSQADEFPDCIPLNDIPAGIGDTYSDGLFYRNGEQVKSTAQLLGEANEILNIIMGGETL